MAAPCCDCDHTFSAPRDPCGLPVRRFEPLPAIVLRRLGPLIGVIGLLWAPVEHAAGFSGRGAGVVLCLAGVLRLARRLRRTLFRWDPSPSALGAPGRDRRRAW
jgi:hypothetical protein